MKEIKLKPRSLGMSRMVEDYQSIINAVESKFEGETRTETAIRYIKEREQGKRNGKNNSH